MKITLKHCIWIAVYFLIFSACESKKDISNTEDVNGITHDIKFVPDPQDIEEHEVKVLPINTSAPDFKLPGVDGNFYTLKDFDSAKVLVIIFTCNHCPTAQAYEDRIIQLVDDYKNEGVRVVAISPNSVKTLLLEELGYSDLGDSYNEMKIRATDKRYNFTYLYDGDTQETSIKYGPVATPHAYVFDQERKLKYSGRLDDSEKPGTANANDLRSSIDAVLLGVEILEPVTKTFGCSVKWGWKIDWTEKVNDDWTKKQVSLNEINENGVKALMKNKSDKLRLINIWATWCGPCVIEYPEFVNIQRMYMGRDFEFISLSADKLEHKDKALKFLKDKNSALRNYIFSGSDIYKLISAVDPEWDGALPYTVLLEPEGKIVYRVMGTIDPLKLKKTIVDHPMIGRYY
ncbi:MAG: redoxin domain-containing protein [Cyclobacteriaceae bacterium]|nr:redoxin domain-containing protein [Cyclobacteriaceae bacterium]